VPETIGIGQVADVCGTALIDVCPRIAYPFDCPHNTRLPIRTTRDDVVWRVSAALPRTRSAARCDRRAERTSRAGCRGTGIEDMNTDLANGQQSWRLQVDMDWRHAIFSIFSGLITGRAAGAITSERWNVARGRLPPLPGTVLLHHSHPGYNSDEWLIDFPPSGFAFVEHEGESVHVRVAADTDAEA